MVNCIFSNIIGRLSILSGWNVFTNCWRQLFDQLSSLQCRQVVEFHRCLVIESVHQLYRWHVLNTQWGHILWCVHWLRNGNIFDFAWGCIKCGVPCVCWGQVV